MRISVKFVLVFGLMLLGWNSVSAQTGDMPAAKTQIVKWEAVAGKDSEFVLYMPQGYGTVSDGNYTLGPGPGSRIDRKITAYRYINGVVMIMEYIEGDAKAAQKVMQERDNAEPENSRTISGFEFSETERIKSGYVHKKQYFRIKNRLYTAQAIAKSAADPIADAFFKSIHLAEGTQFVAPNVPTGTPSVTLAAIRENTATGDTGSPAIDDTQADRRVIELYKPRPGFPHGEMLGRPDGRVRLKVLYSANGKVASVAVVESPSKSFEKAAIESANKVIFLPAEKDGKPVSVYKMVEYTFTTTMGGFMF